MLTKIVGFVGLESYDVMHYAAKVLNSYQFKTILVDASDSGALAATIPSDYVSMGEAFDYQGVDVARVSFFNPKEFGEYDYVYVSFGWRIADEELKECEEVYCFSDYQKHNVRRLAKMVLPNRTSRFLVIKDGVADVYLEEMIEQLQHLNFREQNVYELPFNQEDVLARLKCQYESTFNFATVSKEMQKLLRVILEYDVEPRVLRKNWKSLSTR